MFMSKHFRSLAVLLFGLLVLVLTACGEKSQEDVVKKMDQQLDKLDGYKAKAEMHMKTGEETQKYDLDVWYKDKDFYRVSLTNIDDEKGNQVILKNEDGVFVVTPALNKSFKFQSDWPETSSQPYLYQSLVSDIKKDEGAQFEVTETHYVFTTKTHYQSNQNLPQQEIHINKKTYVPEVVKILDKDEETLVEVQFNEFALDPEFAKDDFVLKEDETEETAASADNEPTEPNIEVMYPEETIGAKLKEKEEIELENGKRIIMTYEGDKNFTLIQENRGNNELLDSPREVNGQIVNLGTTIGAISGNTIQWSERGNHYKLASEELTKEELVSVAKSVQQKQTK